MAFTVYRKMSKMEINIYLFLNNNYMFYRFNYQYLM